MKKKLFFFSILFLTVFECFAQNFEWVREFEGIASDYKDFVTDIAVDDLGNSYILGNTESPDFDINPTFTATEIIDLSGQMYYGMVFLVKLDNDGNYVWGKTFGNWRQGDYSYNLEIGTDGNIYALATISDYDSTQNIINAANRIYKINPDGNILNTIDIPHTYSNWGSDQMAAVSFALDSSNNIYVTGWFYGNIIFQGNENLTLDSDVMTGYLLKLDNNGNGLWLKQFEQIVQQDSDSQVLVRPDGNVIMLQNVQSTIKLFNVDTANGDTIWNRTFSEGLYFAKMYITQNEIVISAKNGYHWLPFDVDPTEGVLYTDVEDFIMFLNLDGSFINHKEFVAEFMGFNIRSITSDEANNLYFTGEFKNTIDFDPSASVYNVSVPPPSTYDIFCLKLDPDRNFSSVLHFGQEVPIVNYHQSQAYPTTAVVKNNSYYFGGNYAGHTDFDPSETGAYTLYSVNISTVTNSGFISKLSTCGTEAPQAAPAQQFCSGTNPTVADLSPSSSSANWYNSNSSTTPLAATSLLVNGTTYYVATQNVNCAESNRTPVTVTINPMPATPSILPQSFCESQNSTLADINTNGQSIQWYNNLTDTTPLPVTTTLSTSTYYAAQFANGCESTRTPITVTINAIAQPTATSPQEFCFQNNITPQNIIVSGQNLKWYDAVSDGNIIPSSAILTNTTTIYVSQTIDGCESTRLPINIIINQTAAPTGNSVQNFCTALNPTINNLVITGNTITVYDSPINGTVITATTPLINGTTYYASQTLNGCESVNRLPITISLISSLPVNNYTALICDEDNDNNENIDLTDYNSYLYNNSGFTFSYYENQAAAINEDANALIANFTSYNLVGDKTIYVVITSVNNCSEIAILNLGLIVLPEVKIPDVLSLCIGKPLTIDAGSLFDNYLWSNGSSSDNITIVNPGTYWFTGSISNGTGQCTVTKYFDVTEAEIPNITNIEVLNSGNTNSLIVYTAGDETYQYSIDGINYQVSNIFENLPPGYYTVYVKNRCSVITKNISVLGYPLYFTPNGDGQNDSWHINFSAKDKDLTTYIFDRYGKLITQLHYNESWDGTYNGHNSPATDYWFIVKKKSNNFEYKGHFSLIR